MSRFLLFILIIASAHACQVPVFRYALERWEADPFRLQIIHQEALAPDFKKSLLEIQGQLDQQPSPINLELEVLDLNKLTEDQQLAVVGLETINRWPAALLHPPASWENASPLAFEASKPQIESILGSPLRQRILDDLLSGESAVWCLIESGDATADQDAFELLDSALKRAAEEIELPEGVYRPDEVQHAEKDVNLDDVLRSSIPLKISFKIERIRRDDPAEQAFLKILMGPTRRPLSGPVLVPVFGRARTPGPVPASAVSEDRIFDACRYLCGACSCQVKSGNPGYDLLFRADWHSKLQSGLIVVQKSLPALPGAGDMQEPVTPAGAGPLVRNDLAATPPSGFRIWTIAGLGLALVLGGGTIFLISKSRT